MQTRVLKNRYRGRTPLLKNEDNRLLPSNNNWTFLSFKLGILLITILLASILTYVFIIQWIILYRSTFHTATNLLCDDDNTCTVDLYETLNGHVPHCNHYSTINTKSCASACVTTGTCLNGECNGICKGVCDVATDCARISAIDIYQFANWSDGINNTFALARSCVLGVCIYNISLTYESTTFTQSNETTYYNEIYSADQAVSFSYQTNYPVDSLLYSPICKSLLADNSLPCIDAYLSELTYNINNNISTIACTYLYSCTTPNAYTIIDTTTISIIYDI